ncbi:MAG: hypothetical protein QN193_08495 [Armatimonadota bacterium]|nr:hypothetical protein [Armatimonadota bacterium]MDR7445151.1 hypothetical protein [Armatimonadota bacterium]MDR7570634.1 hypothetical protein [Armatimonadota bacterium]MDR7613992.1 hypothetical protein [Armatimonadota bacterium]
MRRFYFFGGVIAVLFLLATWAVLERPLGIAAREWQALRVHGALVLFPFLAALSTFGTARAYRPEDRERRVWLGLSVAFLLWALGRVAFALHHYRGMGGRSPEGDVFTAAFFLVVLAAVGGEVRRIRGLGLLTRPQLAFLAVVGFAVLALGAALFLRPVLGQSPLTTRDLVGLLFAFLAVLLVPLGLAPAVAFLGGLWSYAWALFSAGMLCLAVGIMWLVNAVFYGTWFEGHPGNILEMAGFALLAAGGMWHEAILRTEG